MGRVACLFLAVPGDAYKSTLADLEDKRGTCRQINKAVWVGHFLSVNGDSPLRNEATSLTMRTNQTCLIDQVRQGYLRAHRRHRAHLHQIVRCLFVDDGAFKMPTGRGG